MNGESIQSLQDKNERLRLENERLTAEIHALHDEINRLNALVRSFEKSRSWRLTRPLRQLGQWRRSEKPS